MSTPDENPSYADAIAEIEAILERIDEGDADIDELGPLVERATALIQRCRTTLESTEMRVRDALEALTDEETVE